MLAGLWMRMHDAFHHGLRHLRYGELHRGQHRVGQGRQKVAVDAHHRYVLRHAQAGFAQARQQAQRHQVVECHDAGRPAWSLGDLQCRGTPHLGNQRVAVFVQRPAVEYLCPGAQAGRVHGGVKAVNLGSAAHGHAGHGDKRKLFMAFADQMAGCQLRGREVVGHHVADTGAFARRGAAVVAHHRHAALDRRLKMPFVGQ